MHVLVLPIYLLAVDAYIKLKVKLIMVKTQIILLKAICDKFNYIHLAGDDEYRQVCER